MNLYKISYGHSGLYQFSYVAAPDKETAESFLPPNSEIISSYLVSGTYPDTPAGICATSPKTPDRDYLS